MGVWGALLQGVLSVDSSIQGGIAEKKQFDANIQLANDAADDAVRRGQKEAGGMREAGTQLAARQAVAYSNSGVDASSGTPADVIASTSTNSELDALTTENNAAREALGYKKHGIQWQAQAGINASRRNSEVAGTIIGTAGNAASAYSKTGFGV